MTSTNEPKRTALVLLAAGAVTAVLGGAAFVVTWTLREHLPTSSSYKPPGPYSDEEVRSEREYAERMEVLAPLRKRLQNQDRGRELAESFLADVEAGYLDRTYDAFAVYGGGERIGREAFVALLRKQPVFRNPQLPMRSELGEDAETCAYYCNAIAADGRVVQLAVIVVLEGDPKIINFLVGNAVGIGVTKRRTNEMK